jgi:hypothetical protein
MTKPLLDPIPELPAVTAVEASSAPLRRRRWPRYVAFTLLVLVALSGWLVLGWQHLPGTFTVSSLVYIAKKPPRILSASPSEAAASQEDFDDYRRAQEALLKSRLVLNAALRNPKVANLSVVRDQDDPVEWLEKELKTDFNAAPEILTVSLKGDQYEELMKVVDAVVDAYLTEFVHREDGVRADRLARLQGLYTKFYNQVQEKRQNLTALAKILGAKDEHTIAFKHELALENLNQVKTELIKLQGEIRHWGVELRAYEAKEKVLPNQPVPDKAVFDYVEKDVVVRRLHDQIQRHEAQLEDIAEGAAGEKDSVAHKTQDRQLEDVKRMLAARREKLRPVAEKDYRERIQLNLQAEISGLKDKIALAKENERLLNGMVGDLSKAAEKINENALDQGNLTTEIAQAEEMLKKVGIEQDTLAAELLAPPRVSRMQEAVPSKHGRPSPPP